MKEKTPKHPKSNSKNTNSSSSSAHEAEILQEDIFEDGGEETADRNPRTLLGQILVELGYVTVYQLDEALHAQRTERAGEKAHKSLQGAKEQKPLGQIMLELGYCTPNQLIRAIQVQSDYRKAAVRFRDNW